MEGCVKSGSEYMELRGELRGIARWDKVNELDCALWGKWRSITEVRGCPGKGGISTTMAHQMGHGGDRDDGRLTAQASVPLVSNVSTVGALSSATIGHDS